MQDYYGIFRLGRVLDVKVPGHINLGFYINRAGKNLSTTQKRILEQAKIELRRIFNR